MFQQIVIGPVLADLPEQDAVGAVLAAHQQGSRTCLLLCGGDFQSVSLCHSKSEKALYVVSKRPILH